MSKQSMVPDAWDDDWDGSAEKTAPPPEQPSPDVAQKKVSSRVTKAQRRAEQAEFNRQLWQEAEGPKETLHFLEARPSATVPLKNDFKAAPILLSRKAPKTQKAKTIAEGVSGLSVADESSSDEDGSSPQKLTLAERQAKAAKEREEKQRKYEERRNELFGPTSTASAGSGASSPAETTPPGSRSGTPNRGRGGRSRGVNTNNNNSRTAMSGRRDGGQKKELFDPTYSPKPDSPYVQRKEKGSDGREQSQEGIQPIRAPKGPDGSGRGGFGFATRGGAEAV